MCIFFSNLEQLKDLLALMQLKPNSYHDQHLTDQFFPLAIEVCGCLHKQNKLICSKHVRAFMQLCQCQLQMARSFPFRLVYFFSSKKFNYVAKDASIFHLKLNDNGRPN
jgi:hypothetical protein